MAPTRDEGFSFGFTDPSFRNVRLTVYLDPRDQRLHTHISDPSVKRFPWSQQIDPEFFDEVIQRLTRMWTVPMEKVPNVYVMRPGLLKRFSKTLPRAVNDTTTVFPVEVFSGKLRLDFRNPHRWRRVRSRDLSSSTPRFGYAIIKGVAKLVVPHPSIEGNLVCYSEAQFRRFRAKSERLMGAEMFAEYIETRKLVDDYVKAVRARTRQRD